MAVDTSLLDLGYMEAKKLSTTTDFKIFTGAMTPVDKKSLPEADQDKPLVRMCGSSTVMDLQRDLMSMNALHSMTKVDPSLSCWLNHLYLLPEDLYGKLYGSPSIEVQRNLADLWITTEAVLRNPRAERTYNYVVLDKVRLGCSVGCQVLAWHFLDPDDMDSPIVIDDVLVVEWSVVSIPANQRCWVENAIKGVFVKNLATGNGDTALKLAPAFKSLFSRDYSSVVDNITSDGLRKDLSHVKARNTPSGRIMYTFDGEEGFYLDQGTGTKKSLTRDEVTSLLEQSITRKAAEAHEVEKTATLTEESALTDDDLDATKAATGKTSWPLMDIGTEWTGSKAEKQIFDYARNEDGEIVASKAKQCFLHCDPENSDKQSGYSCPYTYIVDGSPKIVPLGVRACCNVLSGGRGGVGASDEDQAGMRAKCKTMVNRINSEFNPDPKWEVPWEKDEKSVDGVDVQKDILNTENGSELIRQNIVEDGEEVDEKTKAGGVKVSADGSHEKWTGTHSHSHPAMGDQGDDKMHSHEHSHDGDAAHGHSHAEKSAEPDVQKASTSGGVTINDDGTHEPMSGTHSHEHPDYGAGEDGSPHSHEHSHSNDADHHHEHAATDDDKSKSEHPDASTSPVEGQETVVKGEVLETATPELTPVEMASLRIYNDIGKSMGLPEVTPAMYKQKCNLVGSDSDAQQVISLVSQLDECTDVLEDLSGRIDGYVDSMMRLMGVPDLDGGEVAQSGGYGGVYSLTTPLKTASGAEISEKNGKLLTLMHNHAKAVHDITAAMHPDCCKCDGMQGDGTAHQGDGTTVEEAQDEARRMGEGPDYSMLASATSSAMRDALMKSLDGVSVKSVVESHVSKAVDAAMSNVYKAAEQAARDANEVLLAVGKLKNMPIGRPITLSRTVSPREGTLDIDNLTSFDELLSVGNDAIQGVDDLERFTRIAEKQIPFDGRLVASKFRLWPAGVGKGMRPPLTSDQRVVMTPGEWDAYESAERDVMVPLIDDPFMGR